MTLSERVSPLEGPQKGGAPDKPLTPNRPLQLLYPSEIFVIAIEQAIYERKPFLRLLGGLRGGPRHDTPWYRSTGTGTLAFRQIQEGL